MAEISAQLKTEDAGTSKKRTLTITDINPEASGEIIKEYLQRLNGLTTNQYTDSHYIINYDLDNEMPPHEEEDTRAEATFSFAVTNFLSGLTGEAKRTKYETNSDGELSIAVNGNHGVLVGLFIDSDTGETKIGNQPLGRTKTAGTLTVRITGTETYKPFEQTYEFT